MKVKSFLSLILIITVMASSVISLTSCMQAVLGSIVTDLPDNNGTNNGTPPTSNSGTSGSGTEEGGTGDTEEGKEPDDTVIFYPDDSDDPTELVGITKALLSAVSIYSTFEVDYGYGYPTDTTVSRGSGVIYKLDRESGDAYIITNYHVVYNASGVGNGISQNISVYLYGQELNTYAIPATYVGGSFANDIAVLKISGSEVLKNSKALAVRVSDSDRVAVLDEVVAIGNPEGYGISATNGIVSVESEPLTMTGADGKTTINPRVIRVSAAVNDGNSGGGLFNSDGNLIGIVNAKRNGSNIDNIAYAIPSNVATRLADNIIYFCDGTTNTTPKKAMLNVLLTAKVLGVDVDSETGKVTKVEIVEVDSISEGSVMAGKLEVGDYINYISVDGVRKDATRIHHVVDMMLLARVGSTVVVGVTRADTQFEITVTITEADLTNV